MTGVDLAVLAAMRHLIEYDRKHGKRRAPTVVALEFMADFKVDLAKAAGG